MRDVMNNVFLKFRRLLEVTRTLLVFCFQAEDGIRDLTVTGVQTCALPISPGFLALYGIGPHTAALLLIAAGAHPGRLRSEAAWAHLCAAAPIPASSGKVPRHRLNPGGDRQAGHALWRIVFTRMGSDPATRAYVDRRTQEGLSKKEIIRCLKRYVAREVYPHLRSSGG